MNELQLAGPTPSLDKWVEMVAPCAELAKMIAGTDFVPEAFRNKPAAITACFMYGAELGIGPMQSLSKIDIVKGRPAPRAELARALLLAAGHDMWVDESTNTRVRVSGHRRGSEHVMTVAWTMDDVKKAGISNGNYQKYPRAMLLARASAELARMVAPDALGGITVFAEEADDLEPATTPTTPATTTTEPIKATTTRRRPPSPTAIEPAADPAPAPAPPAANEPPPPELPGDEPANPNGITADQVKKMMAEFNELGIKDRADRLAFIAAATRPVDSSKDLTIGEASNVIDQLVRTNAGETTMVWNDDGTITLTVKDEASF